MCRFSRDVSRDITFSTTRASNYNVRVMPKSALHHITHQPQHITWPGHMFQSAPPVSCFHLIITGIYVPLFLNLFVKLLLLFMLSCSCVTKYSVILLMFCLFSPVSPFCVSSFLTILVTSLHFLKIKSALPSSTSSLRDSNHQRPGSWCLFLFRSEMKMWKQGNSYLK